MIRLGVAGFGGRMSSLINNCWREHVAPEIRVVAIVDPDEEGARKRLADCDKDSVVFYQSLGEMVAKAELDAIAVGTRCNMHAPYAIEASKYDIPLYLEKPVAISMEQAVELEKAFLNSKCQVVVSFPLRVSPLCAITRQYIEENRIGEPIHIAALNYVNYGSIYWEQDYRNFDITGGLFLQKATHDIDYMMYLMDKKIVRVAASATKRKIFGGNRPKNLRCSECDDVKTCPESHLNRRRSGCGIHLNDHNCLFSIACGIPESGTNEDCSSAILEFEDGSHGIYTQVFFTRRNAARRGSIISGYKGTLDFDWHKNQLNYTRHHQPFSDTIKAENFLEHSGGDLELAYDFFALIKGDERPPRSTIRHGLQSIYVCLAARESSEIGKFVDVRQVELSL